MKIDIFGFQLHVMTPFVSFLQRDSIAQKAEQHLIVINRYQFISSLLM